MGFLHDNNPYYDYHICTNAFHWVSEAEKSIYIEKPYQCLKPGEQLAILSNGKLAVKLVASFHSSKIGYEDLFQDIGLFNDVAINEQPFCRHLNVGKSTF